MNCATVLSTRGFAPPPIGPGIILPGTGVWGAPAGSRDRAPGWGVEAKPPEAEQYKTNFSRNLTRPCSLNVLTTPKCAVQSLC